MATTERTGAGVDRRRVARVVLAVLGVAAVAAILIALRRPPQMGPDEEVFTTVDALYTAVRSRDEKRLADCEQRLHGYRSAGKLPDDAADFLDGVVAKCRNGSWESAAERLYDFMLSQRREGAEGEHKEQPKPKHDPRTKSVSGKPPR